MQPGALRPLDLGGSLDAAIKITRARYRALVTVIFVTTLPALALQALVSLSTSPASVTRTDSQTNLPTFDGGHLALVLAGTALTFVVAVASGALATAGSFRIVSGVYLGDEPSWRESLRFGWSKLRSVLWITLLVLLASVVGLIAFVIGTIWARTVFAVAMPVLLVEDVRGTAALGRSRRLVKGRFWSVFGVLLIATLLAGVVQGAITAPALFLVFTANGSVGQVLATFALTLIATTLVAPFTAAVVVVVYFDLRVRKEGFDLVLLAQRVGAQPSPEGFPNQPGAPAWSRPGAPAPTWDRSPPWIDHGAPAPTWTQPAPQPPPGWSPPPPRPPLLGLRCRAMRRRPIAERPHPTAGSRAGPAARLAALLLVAATALLAAASPVAGARPAPATPATPTVGADARQSSDVTSAELQDLAARAEHDPAALARLRDVRSVDGRPVDLRTVLSGADGPQLQQRLRLLAGSSPPAGAGAPEGDRAAARRILDGDRYQPADVPRPLRGVLQWIADRFEPVVSPPVDAFQSLVSTPLGAVGVGSAALVLGGLAARVLIGRRSRADLVARTRSAGGDAPPDPAELDRRADRAEADGDLDGALRLRFHAGLLRLDRAGAVPHPDGLTSGAVARRLRSTEFDELASTFDQVVYGGRSAVTDDLDHARRGWARVLAEASGR